MEEVAPKATPLIRHGYAVVVVKNPTAGIRQVSITHVYSMSRHYRNSFWPDAKHARRLQAPCWGSWCLERKLQLLQLRVSALVHSLAIPFLQVRIKPLQGSQELHCPLEYGQALPPSIMNTHNSFRVQRQSCKRLVIPQGALKIYVLSPTQAAGDVYRSPVSAELREQ